MDNDIIGRLKAVEAAKQIPSLKKDEEEQPRKERETVDRDAFAKRLAAALIFSM